MPGSDFPAVQNPVADTPLRTQGPRMTVTPSARPPAAGSSSRPSGRERVELSTDELTDACLKTLLGLSQECGDRQKLSSSLARVIGRHRQMLDDQILALETQLCAYLGALGIESDMDLVVFIDHAAWTPPSSDKSLKDQNGVTTCPLVSPVVVAMLHNMAVWLHWVRP